MYIPFYFYIFIYIEKYNLSYLKYGPLNHALGVEIFVYQKLRSVVML